MRLQIVPARTGWTWVGLGWKTFLRQPLALAGVFFLAMLLGSLVSLIPGVGMAMVLTAMPAMFLGLMAAAREADAGRFPMPVTLFAAFRGSRERTRQMLMLGAGYALAMAIILVVVTFTAGDAMGPLDVGENPTQEELQGAVSQRSGALLLLLLLYAPLALGFWHAPALVHWHGVAPLKAVFFSLAACWANRGAMLVYMAGWALLFVVLGNLVVAVAAMLGGAAALQIVVLPVLLLMAAMFHTSVYFTYRDSFQTQDNNAPAA